MPAVYQDYGIRFAFPENWELELTRQENQITISVESPGSGFWAITLHDTQVAPETVANAALKAMRTEYSLMDAEGVEEQFGDWPAVGHDVNFFCLDLTNTCWIRAFRTPAHTALILFQATDSELEQMEPVFRAICTSLTFADA